MQTDNKELYRKTSERENESEQLYKDLGSFVFNNLYHALRRPPKLIIKLRGVGTWYLRKKRINALLDLYPPNYDKKPSDFQLKHNIMENENKIQIYELFQQRSEEYEEYIKLRNKIREKRYETQRPLEPDKE